MSGGSAMTGPTCGFIGIGDQGAPIARRMIDAGFETWLWARREASFEPFRDSAARYAATVEELGAKCDHVGICVVNDNDVREVCGKLFPAMRAGSRVAIHSTIHPDNCRALADQAREHGLVLIDAPVSGGSPAAKAGALTLMLGGDAEAITLAMPVFESFGKHIVHLGDVGAGQEVKLINNALLVANIGLAHQALEAGDRLGVDRGKLVELLQSSSGRSFGLEVRGRMQSPAGFRHGGALLRKDINLLLELIPEEGGPGASLAIAAKPFLDAAAEPDG
ncbi:NAD(P)-dependent oxidoreductase [Novosphingobium sp. TH158]|uniref:NAD(P)-dependent oxidoreductase n=1 Tax=Novosphingobium sp. TH158 TaxID=2067455 RepID=UPI0020B130B1|nr:NAD(P)-dependent oxidoreductase [Novosphingobium sp. TH158]